jgi:hypothetical protein
LKVRTVPTSVAEPGMTLNAPRSPACMAHRLMTALSMGLHIARDDALHRRDDVRGHQHRVHVW